MSDRVLLLSWEYPPVIEGGLARHVRKLAEALVRRGVVVDVLTRGAGGDLEPMARHPMGPRVECPSKIEMGCWCTACPSPAGRAIWIASSRGWSR